MSACKICGHDPDDILIVTDMMLVNTSKRKLLASIEAGETTAKELVGIVQQAMKLEEARLALKLKEKSEGDPGGVLGDLRKAAQRAREIHGEQGHAPVRPKRRAPVGEETGVLVAERDEEDEE